MLRKSYIFITLSFFTTLGMGCLNTDQMNSNTAAEIATNTVNSALTNTAPVEQWTEKVSGKKPKYCFPRFRAILVGRAYEGIINLSTVRDKAIASDMYVLEHLDNETSELVYLQIQRAEAGNTLELSLAAEDNDTRISFDGCGDVTLVPEQYKTLFRTLGLDSTYVDRMYFEEKEMPNAQLID